MMPSLSINSNYESKFHSDHSMRFRFIRILSSCHCSFFHQFHFRCSCKSCDIKRVYNRRECLVVTRHVSGTLRRAQSEGHDDCCFRYRLTATFSADSNDHHDNWDSTIYLWVLMSARRTGNGTILSRKRRYRNISYRHN